jgi:hypothetical protein
MTDKFVVHVQQSGGYLPFDTQVLEGLNEAVEYILMAYNGNIDNLQALSHHFWYWSLEHNTYATIDPYNHYEHKELPQ